MTHRICLADPPTSLDRHYRSPADLSLLRHPFASWSPLQWCRNIDLLPIGYAFRPHLRTRLTLSGLTFLWKHWVLVNRVFRPFFPYSYRNNPFILAHQTLSV